jgi:hypothetical protein
MKRMEIVGSVAAIASSVALGRIAVEKGHNFFNYLNRRKKVIEVAEGIQRLEPPTIRNSVEVVIPASYEGPLIPERVIAGLYDIVG